MNRLPSGTVTFLFTDIEGSTRLAQRHRQTWEALRERHHTILRGAIDAQHGYVFQIVGDAFCAAFHTAGDALRAAARSQIDLNGEKWGDAVVKVRMGIHTGGAELQQSGEYHGFLAMSHVQRLMSAGHGGQVLISHAAQELAGDDLPAGVSLLDLGQHQLKDWIRSEPIYQVVAAGLPADFPPLQTVDARPHNLPPQLTSFIGREQEMAEIKQAILDYRIVTLTGSGGTGKTRLSLQVAADLLDKFPDGVWFIEFAPLIDPDLLPQTVLSTMHIGEQADKTALQSLIDALAGKTSLLILDNCEHLVEASARLTDALLRGAPALRILTSSRETLGVPGEMAWHVPSLSLPDSKRLPDINALLQCEAVRLFCERARLAQPHFALTAENAPAVAQICLRLDGIPLAIELAAARVKALSVEQIAARLDDRFRLLTGGSRTALPRQQTLRALIDWSYNLLSEQEKILFRRLAVFVGGWMLEAAEQVGAGPEDDDYLQAADVLDLLTHLVDKSLVITEDTTDGTRYRLFETIRQYAREMLLASDEMRLLRDRHMHTFLAYAEQATSELHGPEQAVWMVRLAREHDNFSAALAWSLDAQPELGLHLATSLAEYWDTRGHFAEARKWLEATLSATHGLPPTQARVRVIFDAMGLASRQGDIERWKTLLDEGDDLAHILDYKPGIALGLHARGLLKAFLENDYDQAEGLFTEALAIRRQLGDRLGIGQGLGPLASCALNRYDYAQAERLFDESLALFRAVGDEREIAGALWNLSEVALWRRDYETARARTEESLALYRRLEDSHGIATALRTFSSAAANQGDLDQARTAGEQSVGIFRALEDRACLGITLSVLACHLRALGELQPAASTAQESIALLREVGDKVYQAGALDAWGRIALAQGDISTARQHFLDGLVLQQEMKDLRYTPSLLEGVAQLVIASGRPHLAIRLSAVAATLRDHIGLARLEVDRAGYERVLASLRDPLDEASFQALWAEGCSLTTAEAIDLAAEIHPRHTNVLPNQGL